MLIAHARQPAQGLLRLSALLLLLVLLAPLQQGQAQLAAIYNATYSTLESAPCARLLNAHGHIGCSSKSDSGARGVLYGIETQEALSQFEAKAPSDDENMRLLRDSSKVAAIIILITDQRPPAMSMDDPCPNCEFSHLRDVPNKPNWNPAGTSLYREPFSIPIFAIPPDKTDTITRIRAAIAKNVDNGYTSYPLISAELSAFMWAAVDAETCLRRRWCLPVGGYSVYSSTTPKSDFAKKDTVVLAAATSGRAFFHDLGAQVENNLSGMVGLLAVADALSRLPTSTFSRNILYTFFNGEAWGFAGSQRFVRDISQKFVCNVKFEKSTVGCPYTEAACAKPCRTDNDLDEISLDKVAAVVELNQIGHSNTEDRTTFFVHTDDNSAANAELARVFFSPASPRIVAASETTQQRLPPTSASSFIQARKLPAVVVSDYQSRFSK
ncbi:Nicastrin-domain-containing protein [Thamnocephalis sphaerospora]|uniref:Nicastrin n=1 Tax=Thamnocephalis sphaerospora TaxID=78915 RepID=A0A4P9XIX0_9FUNG|nr:Nicastrin-domain-containing protein [Thamnocephalis sphaerospora]|eukprot:RKP05674.1 Nicastrin-domain-containing protein [Thamnocephalis sphaerospora]